MDPSKVQGREIPVPIGLPEDVIISPDTLRTNRIPPRQSRTRKWPVLDAFGPPSIDLDQWKLEVRGLVTKPTSWSWPEFRALPRVRVFSDFHCVTRWSRLGNLWEGVRTAELLKHLQLLPQARYVLVYAYDSGWSTNMPLEAFFSEDALLADTHDGEPLSPEHGGPVRVVVPRLYAWKSAKWVSALEFLERDEAGFWERGGYHMNGDPWNEERYR